MTRKPVTEREPIGGIAEITLSLPAAYVLYLDWNAKQQKKTLEQYIANDIKEHILDEIDAMEQSDFAGFFGADLQRDYVEKRAPS